jgi:hypothetical protein
MTYSLPCLDAVTIASIDGPSAATRQLSFGAIDVPPERAS